MKAPPETAVDQVASEPVRPAALSLLSASVLLTVAVALAPGGWPLAAATSAAAGFGIWWARLAPRSWPTASEWGRLAGLALFACALNLLFGSGPGWRELGAGWMLGLETAGRLVAIALLTRGALRALAPLEALGAFERAARPLSRWGFDPERAGVVFLVALRLVPSLSVEARRLARQRALRDRWPGPAAPWRERRRRLSLGLRALPEVLVPLVLLTLRRADELAWALPARYYGLGPRTPAPKRPWRARDWVAVSAAGGIAVSAAWLRGRT